METIFYGGNILTMEGDEPEAVMVRDGLIAETGDLYDIRKKASEDANEINLSGKTLMPAFIDGHSHISMAAQMSMAADLRDCLSFEDIIDTLKLYLKDHSIKSDGMLLGFGYDHNFLAEGKHPSRKELNRVSQEIPIVIMHVSGHMGAVNDMALSLAGITRETKDIEGGVIGREEGTKEPDGYLEECALMRVQAPLMAGIKFDMAEALQKIQQEYLKYGITTVQDGASSAETVEILKKAGNSGLLVVDVVAYPVITGEVDRIFELNREYDGQYVRHFKLGGYKAILDGSPQGRSAWLTRPYENCGEYCAYPWFNDDQTLQFMKKAICDKKQILVHCNGDAAGDQFLRCYESALRDSNRVDKMELRPVMIHCQTARRDQLVKMKELKMLPSIFVGHTFYWGDVHLRNLGRDRGMQISPCRSALQQGLKINFHQDTPVTKPDMLHSVWCAVNRITRDGTVIGEEECIGVYEALKAITIDAAYAYFEENEKGSIKENKKADLVILDKNPLEVSKMDIRNIRVLSTYKDGKLVYQYQG